MNFEILVALIDVYDSVRQGWTDKGVCLTFILYGNDCILWCKGLGNGMYETLFNINTAEFIHWFAYIGLVFKRWNYSDFVIKMLKFIESIQHQSSRTIFA